MGTLSRFQPGLGVQTGALPPPLVALLAGSWGILIGLSGFGVERLIRLELPKATAELGAISLFTGGAIMATMLIVQQTLVGYFRDYRAALTDEVDIRIIDWVDRGTAPIHLRLNIAWDFFPSLPRSGFSRCTSRHGAR